MNYYPHHIGDYTKDTMALSQGEHGAYRLLIDAAYAGEDGIAPDEVHAIARAASAAERRNADRVIAKFFTLRDGRYYQSRIDREVAAYQEKSAKASASAQKRWSERNANAMPSHMRTHSERSANGDALAMLSNNQEPKDKGIVGQKPDPASLLRRQAAEIIQHLNAKAGRKFDLNGVNADAVVARLREGATRDDLLAVVDAKVAEWLPDEKMAKYLRPETLFNRTKFASYKGELGAASGASSPKADL